MEGISKILKIRNTGWMMLSVKDVSPPSQSVLTEDGESTTVAKERELE